MTVFPDELYPAPQSWAERAYPKLIHFNKVDRGGHFAAWEQPQIFSDGDPGDVQVAAVTATARLPVEGRLPELDGATAWLNSAPLTPHGLRGKVVVVQFCTFSCINWLRTVPYVKAWAEKYRDDGLVVIGVHSPEFPFEHDLEKIRAALEAMGIGYPIAVDNEFAVWRAFDNAYWPALYFVDARGTHPAPPLRRGGLRALRAGHPAAARRGRERRCATTTWCRSSRTASSSPRTGPRCGRRRPTSATPGPPASPHRAASRPTADGSTPSRRSSRSTSGRSPATGRSGTRSRR